MSGYIQLTHVSDGLTWRQNFDAFGGGSITSTLPAVAPAGDYIFDFSTNATFVTSHGGPGFAELDLAFVPEPATLGALATPLLLLRRRRTR